jgi:hypothetical protein
MSYAKLDLTGTLGTALDATSNPDPNTLTTKNPYKTVMDNPQTFSTAWISQAKKALFPLGVLDGSGEKPIKLHFVPSSAGATYTVTMYVFDTLSGTWGIPFDNGSLNLTGDQLTYIARPGNDPIFLKLSAISAGTLSIYFDGSTAKAA